MKDKMTRLAYMHKRDGQVAGMCFSAGKGKGGTGMGTAQRRAETTDGWNGGKARRAAAAPHATHPSSGVAIRFGFRSFRPTKRRWIDRSARRRRSFRRARGIASLTRPIHPSMAWGGMSLPGHSIRPHSTVKGIEASYLGPACHILIMHAAPLRYFHACSLCYK
jgi:hypothetical protein